MAGGQHGERRGDPGFDALWVDQVVRFKEAAGDGTLGLDLGAALIGRLIEPTRAPQATIEALDRAAGDVEDDSLEAVLDWFGGSGFRGDRSDTYTSPLNSSIGRVLDERVGIPISLSVVLIEVARRRGVALSGVNMPGHFLIRDDLDEARFIDAFAGGAVLDRHEAETLHRQIHGDGTGFHPSFLAPAPTDRVLVRLLNNLRLSASSRGDLHALRWVLRLMDVLGVSRTSERRRLGRLLANRLRLDDAADEFDALAADLAAATGGADDEPEISSGEPGSEPSGAELVEALQAEAVELRRRLN